MARRIGLDPIKRRLSKERHRATEKRKTTMDIYNHSPRRVAYQRDFYLQQRYGITAEEFERVFDSQGRKCGICDTGIDTDQRTGKPKALSVDHCHITGRVRGILCKKCNMALGLLGDSIESMERALNYMRGISNA